MRILSASVCLLAVGSVALLAQNPKKKDDPSQIGSRDVGKGVNIYSIEREIALGKQLAQEVQRQAKVVEDPLISEYINRIGQNLVRNSDAKVPFTFQLIEGDSPNAFALPGGYIFVYTGLIKLADEEDELAAALAHEIAHVAARHMTKQATKSEIVNLASIPAAVILGGGIGRDRGPPGCEPGRPRCLPALHPQRRSGGRLSWPAIFVRRRLRPHRRHQHLRKDRVPAEEQARHSWRAFSPPTRWMPIASKKPKRKSAAFFPRATSTSSILPSTATSASA